MPSPQMDEQGALGQDFQESLGLSFPWEMKGGGGRAEIAGGSPKRPPKKQGQKLSKVNGGTFPNSY